MTGIDIRLTATVPCAGGILRFDPDGVVTLIDAEGSECSVVVTGLELSNFVEFWCGESWMCFLGMKSGALWCAWPLSGKIAQISRLDRLDLQDQYDPGGLHRVAFQELPGGDLLIVHEIGLARISPDGTLCWQQVHDQLAAHFERLGDDVVWFQGEYGRFGFRLVDGRPIVS